MQNHKSGYITITLTTPPWAKPFLRSTERIVQNLDRFGPQAMLGLAVTLLFGLIAFAFARPHLLREVAPEARPLEEHEWRDSYGLPYKPRGLF